MYMQRFEMQQVFKTDEEVAHWFLSGRGEGDNAEGCGRRGQVVWAYVVEVRPLSLSSFHTDSSLARYRTPPPTKSPTLSHSTPCRPSS